MVVFFLISFFRQERGGEREPLGCPRFPLPADSEAEPGCRREEPAGQEPRGRPPAGQHRQDDPQEQSDTFHAVTETTLVVGSQTL